MTSTWVSQAIYPTTTERVSERVRYLRRPLEATVTGAIRSYFDAAEPLETQTQVTLACLQAIGYSRFLILSQTLARSPNVLKQDLGMFIPVLLVNMFGAENVETYRNSETNKASTRSNTWRDLHWVSRYTPHKVKNYKK